MAKRSVVVGADSWISMVEELSVNSDRLSSRAVYGGAATIADGIREAIKRIPAQTVDGGNRRGVTDVERQGLLDGLGVAQHQRADGVVNTKIGFDGYNAYITKKYPKGHPNSMVARSVESGTSWLTKTPFIAPTARRLKASTVAAMQAELDDYIRKKEK